jgi:hypothetical protein
MAVPKAKPKAKKKLAPGRAAVTMPKPKPKPKPKPSPKPTEAPARAGTFPADTPAPKAFPANTPAPAPGLQPKGSPTPYRGFGSPPPTPTPPPPHGLGNGVLVHWGGLSSQHVHLRYGQPLRIAGARGFNQWVQLMVVNPAPHFGNGVARPLTSFPAKLDARQKYQWLGAVGNIRHQHWAIARGPSFEIESEAFLALYERLNGESGYLWPMRFLCYVVVDPPPNRGGTVYYKLVVTITK